MSEITAPHKYAHTPGPWFVNGPSDCGEGLNIATQPSGQWGYYTATAWDGLPTGQMEANAKLIASAPALIAERDALRDQIAQLESEIGKACDTALRMSIPTRELVGRLRPLLSSCPATGEGR